MHSLNHEYQFQYVILRYVPDFARDEFVNGGIVLHDMQNQRILGRVTKNPEIYRCIDREGRYMLFVESTRILIRGLQKDVERFKRGAQDKLPMLVGKAFHGSIIPNAGFYDFSNIRSGVTDDIEEKFEWLYRRFVDAVDVAALDQETKPAEVKSNIIELFLDNLRETPHQASFLYAATGGKYLFDTSFIDEYHVFLKTVRVRSKKNGTVEWGSVLQNLVVLADLKVTHPDYTFGILLDFAHETSDSDRVTRLVETIESLTARFKQANVDLVLANRKEVEHYLMIKGLLKKHRQK